MEFQKILQVLCLCLLTACTTPNRTSYEAAKNEDAYFGPFQVMAARIGVTLAPLDSKNDQVTLLLHDTSAHRIGITAYFSTLETETPTEALLIVNIHDGQFDILEHENGVTKGSYMVQIYETYISPGQFDEIRQQATSQDFLKQPYSNKPPGVTAPQCRYGTTYAIGALISGENHAVRRHQCDDGFSETITTAAPLFAAAKSAFPELENRLTKAETDIKNY